MSTRGIVQRIFAVLQPLTGTRSTGTATVRSTLPTLTLPANALAYPIVASASGARQIDPSRPVRVAAETAVTSAGVSVPVTSLLGGPSQNLPAGTEIRWAPQLEGLEAVSPLAGAMTGGLAATGPGSLRRITYYEQVGSVDSASDLFFAKGGPFPAGVLEWLGSDGGERVGNGVVSVTDRWRLDVVTARLEGSEARAAEGFDILDAAMELLVERASVDGCTFSSPAIEIQSRQRIAVTPGSYIYGLTFATHSAARRKDARTYADWLATRYQLTTATEPPLPLVDVTDPMPTAP